MADFESDYILRAVKQVAQLLARVLQLRREEKDADAERAIADAYLDLFGLDPRYFALMDARTALQALGHPERARAFARVLHEHADLLHKLGQADRAELLRSRATELLRLLPEARPS